MRKNIRKKREAVQSPPSSARLMYAQNFTSILPPRLHGAMFRQRDDGTFTLAGATKMSLISLK
jgi:hypothetical protein